jgi:hypothetical protein
VSNFIRPPHRLASRAMISKLIKAGYLRPTQRNNVDAIAIAIAKIRQDLRSSSETSFRANNDDKEAT